MALQAGADRDAGQDLPQLTSDPGVAAAALLDGRLAGLPTETVYGLGALADNEDAVRRTFAVKGRPADHPLIVHVRDTASATHWSGDWNPHAQALAEEFWPGPLTVITRRSSRVTDAVTGGQPTVALRSPDHHHFQQVLEALARAGVQHPGVTAPSANRFGAVSPTTAAAVLAELSDRLTPGDVVLDGGTCHVGIESTIVDCSSEQVRIRRLGAITSDMISDLLGSPVATSSTPATAGRVSGELESHYSPAATVELVERDQLNDRVAELAAQGGAVGVITTVDQTTSDAVVLLAATSDEHYAQSLYAALRSADAQHLDHVLAVAPTGSGIADAVSDRLRRAAASS